MLSGRVHDEDSDDWRNWPALKALKTRLGSAASERRIEVIAERLQALRTRQATLEGRERELLPRLQLAELERDRTAADIRMGEAWELAIAASRGFSTRLRREADRLARERAATQRAITILEGRLPLAQRVEAAVARAREQALAELQDGDDSPKTASTRGPRQLEAVRQRANRWRWE